MSPERRRTRGAYPGSADQAAAKPQDRGQRNGAVRPARRLLTPMIEYGRDWPDLDLWCDRDGRLYRSRGPYERLPLRWARRKVAHGFVVARRWTAS